MARKPIHTSNSHAGYHPFRDEMGKPMKGTSCWIVWRDYGDVDRSEFDLDDDEEFDPHEYEGWYYTPCYPGCLPDGDFTGPFATSRAAYREAMQA